MRSIRVTGPTQPLAFTSTPPTAAVVGEQYLYNADDSYDAPSRYTLVPKPAAMTVQATTGVVACTPSAPGPFQVVGHTPAVRLRLPQPRARRAEHFAAEVAAGEQIREVALRLRDLGRGVFVV